MAPHGSSGALEVLLIERAYLYELFHKFLGGRPDSALLEIACSQVTASVLGRHLSDWDRPVRLEELAEAFRQVPTDELATQFSSEYEALLWKVGSSAAYPWESTYVAGEPVIFQRSTLEVRAAYRREGLQVRCLGRIPDDHLSIMCSFAALMSVSAVGALGKEESEEACGILRRQSAFIESHMVHWVWRYAEDLGKENAELIPLLVSALAELVKDDRLFLKAAVMALSDGGVAGDGRLDDGEETPEDATAEIAVLERAYEQLAALRLFGIDENELMAS